MVSSARRLRAPAATDTPCVALDDKIAFLKRPDSYPDSPSRVETVETHMSWVFLTDRLAYKLKKPVRYEFLDFSTLGARHWDCREEVRLNRRLAPDVYIGVVALTAEPDGTLQLGGDGESVDWLVEMRRLPAERMLDRAIGEGRATKGDVLRVARQLADFYKTSRPVPIAPSDYRQRLQADVGANLRALVVPDYRLSAATARRAAAAQLELLGCEPELFAERVREGRIIEAHGDLRAEHVCLSTAPVIIDCLEFNRGFRTLDPADELAFLALDCERLGAPWIKDLLFDVYRRTTGDRPDERLVHFYTSHRACLRAKIAIWHLRESEVRQPGKWRELARTYLRLAERYARRLR
jgi:aminoglycoside phosphotransferase family enzyme